MDPVLALTLIVSIGLLLRAHRENKRLRAELTDAREAETDAVEACMGLTEELDLYRQEDERRQQIRRVAERAVLN